MLFGLVLLACGAPIDEEALPADVRESLANLAVGLVSFRTTSGEGYELDQGEIDSLHGALVGIYALEDEDWAPARDQHLAYFSQPDVRDSLFLSSRWLQVDVRNDAPWLDAWNAGDARTGNAEVDDLLDQMQIVPVPIGVSMDDWFELHGTGEPFNAERVGAELKATGEFDWVAPDGSWGRWEYRHNYFWLDPLGGVGVRATRGPLYEWRYRVFMGWGDCPSGCIYGHVWTLAGDAHGHAQVVKSEGDDVATRGDW